MAYWKLFAFALLMACTAFSTTWCDDTQTFTPGNAGNRINPGWYGWMGDFHDVNGYYAHPSDREYYRRHNINWFMLGHQWVVPFLQTDTYQVKTAILENCDKARIWYEAYWWGDHSAWESPGTRHGFGMNHIPKPVLEKLKAKGITPGGDNIVGKDWIAAATDPDVLRSIKKTIGWQIDTIIKHCGPNALYGVVLSEEEPDHGVHVVLGQKGTRYYGEHRKEILPHLIKVHNELYDFIKTRYPQLKVSPGFYPAWVEPGTLKMDAAVMDLYPPPGKEENYINQWVAAYGDVPKEEHYILLWGYGDGDRKMECERFDRITEGLIRRGYRNLGVFHPRLALWDRVHRLFDVDASGNYGPYHIEEHRKNIETLWGETARTAEDLKRILGDGMPPLPSVPSDAWASREKLKAWTGQIYDFREGVLDVAYSHVQKMQELRKLAVLISLLKAEGLIPPDTDEAGNLSSTQLGKWESVSKEYRQVPAYFETVIPVEKELAAHAGRISGVLLRSNDPDDSRYPKAIREGVTSSIRRIAAFMARGEIAKAEQEFYGLHGTLCDHQVEKSYQLKIVFENRYEFPLNLSVKLTADWGVGAVKEIYSGYPCETADRLTELVLYLPGRPASITISTSSWSGALTVRTWELSNSREQVQPTSVEDVDHIESITEWLDGQSTGFTLSPWASRSGARIVYGEPERGK